MVVTGQTALLLWPNDPPCLVLPAGYEPGSVFEGKLLADRVDTVWGTISLVTAERMLLEEALKDPSNKQVRCGPGVLVEQLVVVVVGRLLVALGVNGCGAYAAGRSGAFGSQPQQ